MSSFWTNGKFWIGVGCFAGGVFASSKLARKIAVKGMAAGMQTRDCIKAGWENIKEEANDLYEDAQEEVAAKADGDEVSVPAVAVKPARKKSRSNAKSGKGSAK